MLRLVLDTGLIISARRSPSGASNEMLRRLGRGRFQAIASAAMFFEYEAVMKRPEQLAGMQMTTTGVDRFLDALAGLVTPVTPHYLWRPLLTDPADEMFVEAAVVGRAEAIVTFNVRHFEPAIGRFAVEAITPAAALRRIR